MGVLTFGFPEQLFRDNRDDDKTTSFLEGIDIDLFSEIEPGYPTLGHVKSAIRQTVFDLANEQATEDTGRQTWYCELFKAGEYKTSVSIDDVRNEADKVTTISFGRGDDDTIIEFLWYLSKDCGSILFFQDTGVMTLVRANKSVYEIKQSLKNQ